MKIELDLQDLIEKGFNYMDILEEIVEPAFRSEFDIAKKKVALKTKVMDAKARVANGTYTHDDLTVLANALQGFCFTSATAVATKKVGATSISTKVITESEMDDILSQL